MREHDIEALIEPAIEVMGFELWGLELVRRGKQSLLRILSKLNTELPLMTAQPLVVKFPGSSMSKTRLMRSTPLRYRPQGLIGGYSNTHRLIAALGSLPPFNCVSHLKAKNALKGS